MPHATIPHKTEQAAGRLSAIVNLGSVLEYATTLHDPTELKFVKQMVMDLCLRNKCCNADVAECVRFVQGLIDGCYRHEVHNHGCQQFYGPMHNSKFISSKNNRKKRKYERHD